MPVGGLGSKLARLRFVSRADLVRQTGANAVATAGPQLFLLAMTPLLVSRLALGGYGIWTFCLATIAIASNVDGGLGPTISRYFALYRGRGDEGAQHLLATFATLSMLLLGGLSALVLHEVGGAIASHMHVHDALRSQAQVAVRDAGIVVGLGLLGNVFSGYLRGRASFGLVAVGAFAGIGGFLVYWAVTPESKANVATYIHCAAAQNACTLVVWAIGAVIGGMRFAPAVPAFPEIREIFGFAWRSQIASATSLVSLQADSLVIGAVCPVRTLGIYGIAATVATAFRNLPFYALFPIRVRVTTIFGASALQGANRALSELERRWRPIIVGYSLIAAPVAVAIVYYWLTPRVGEAVVILFFLLVAYATDLAAGVRVAYANAVGQPGLLARLGVIALVINVGLTVPLVLVIGAYGVVGPTAIASLVTTVYIFVVTPFGQSSTMGRVGTLREAT